MSIQIVQTGVYLPNIRVRWQLLSRSPQLRSDQPQIAPAVSALDLIKVTKAQSWARANWKAIYATCNVLHCHLDQHSRFSDCATPRGKRGKEGGVGWGSEGCISLVHKFKDHIALSAVHIIGISFNNDIHSTPDHIVTTVNQDHYFSIKATEKTQLLSVFFPVKFAVKFLTSCHPLRGGGGTPFSVKEKC